MTILCTTGGPPTALGVDVRTAADLSTVDKMLTGDPGELRLFIGPDVTLLAAPDFAAAQRLARPALGVLLIRHAPGIEELTVAEMKARSPQDSTTEAMTPATAPANTRTSYSSRSSPSTTRRWISTAVGSPCALTATTNTWCALDALSRAALMPRKLAGAAYFPQSITELGSSGSTFTVTSSPALNGADG